MSKHPKKFIHYLLGSLAGVFVLRTLKLAYHRTNIKHVIESVLGSDPNEVQLNQSFVDSLPKNSFGIHGRPTEPLNMILVGESAQIKQAFYQAGWVEAVPINASNWAKAFWAGLRDESYPTGPMTPYYINTTPQDLSFQKETDRRSFRQRHHVRFWRTNLHLKDGRKVWLGMASFDKSLRLVNGLRFPYHHIDPDLDAERDLIVSNLLEQGGREINRFSLSGKMTGKNDHGDHYYSDGKIVAVDLSEVKN